MSETAPYPYVGTVLLERPFHYMYTPFAGRPFLDAWRSERARFRDVLQAAEAADLRMAIPARPETSWTTQPGEARFETREVLLDLAVAEIKGSDTGESARRRWIGALTKRFEVTKRLHAAYDERLRPAGNEWRNPENYALLAVILGMQYVRSRDLRRVNTLLKLVDLLASLEDVMSSPLAVSCALAAVRFEREAVEGLMRQHGIAVGC